MSNESQERFQIGSLDKCVAISDKFFGAHWLRASSKIGAASLSSVYRLEPVGRRAPNTPLLVRQVAEDPTKDPAPLSCSLIPIVVNALA